MNIYWADIWSDPYGMDIVIVVADNKKEAADMINEIARGSESAYGQSAQKVTENTVYPINADKRGMALRLTHID